MTVLFTQTLLMQVQSDFINADLSQICTNLITILIAQKQSVITSHERELGDNKHESQSVSLWVQGKEGSRQCLARENLQSKVGGRADESSVPQGRASGSRCQGKSEW